MDVGIVGGINVLIAQSVENIWMRNIVEGFGVFNKS